MSSGKKHEIITFKVDTALANAMRRVSNRSEFIRSAILMALHSVCPLCRGSGILTSEQRQHWNAFAANHSLEECGECHVVHIVCDEVSDPAVH